MSKMIPQFNSIILDVAVIVILLAVIALGAFKGIKHVSINFVLFMGSLALALTSLTNIVKEPILAILSEKIKLGAGVGDEAKLGAYFLYPLMASLILAVLVYVVLRLLKCLIVMIARRKMVKANKLPPSPGKKSRIFGALFSLVFNGALVVILLSILNTPLVGLDKTMETSKVATHVASLDDLVIELVSDDELLDEKVLIKLVRGDVLVAVSDQDAQAIADISELIAKGGLIPEKLDEPQKAVDALHSVLLFVTNHALDDEGVERDGFEKAVELTRDLVAKSVNKMNTLNAGQAAIEAEDTLAVSNLIRKLGLAEAAATFEAVFVIK